MTAAAAPPKSARSDARGAHEPADFGVTPILGRLGEALEGMSPQVQRAATYVLDNPGEVAVTSMRGIAEAADVKPNTLVRMARAVGFDGYEDFRAPFRQHAADGAPSFPDRARFLRSINEGGRHGALLADMAAAALANVETLFADVDVAELKAAADLIDGAQTANVLGVGTGQPLAANFAYVARMAVDNISAIPTIGLAIDDVGHMTPDDVLVAITFRPYRFEIVDAVELAADRGVPVIAVTDGLGSPIARRAHHTFVVPNDSPLPFSSSIATTALLETLLAFVVADSPDDVVSSIDAFHANRRSAGIYIDGA